MTDRSGSDEVPPVPEQIDCIDCGGRAHLLTYPPEDGRWLPGDLITYRCEDCLDRWDIVLTEDDDDESGRGDDPTPERSSGW